MIYDLFNKKNKRITVAFMLFLCILSNDEVSHALTYKDDFSIVPINAIDYSDYSFSSLFPDSSSFSGFPEDLMYMAQYSSFLKPVQYSTSRVGSVKVVYGINGRWINDMEQICVVDENKKNKYGYKDINGAVVIPAVYDMIMPFNEDIARANLDGKYGFLDKSGNSVIPFVYDFIWDFHYIDLTPACIEGLYGYIDRQNHIVLPYIYSRATPFINNTAVVSLPEGASSGKTGVIDIRGNYILNPEYTYINRIGTELFSVKKNSKFGVYDNTGNVIIPPIYDYISEPCEEIFIVKEGSKYGVIDISGNIIIPLLYDNLKPFSEGAAEVQIDKKWGYIGKDGSILLPCIYKETRQFGDGLAAVKTEEAKGNDYAFWKFIDKAGNDALPDQYIFPGVFNDGYAIVGPEYTARAGDGKSKIIDKQGNIIWNDAGGVNSGFENGLAYLQFYPSAMAHPDYPGLITSSGELITAGDYISKFKDGAALFSSNSNYMIIDKRYISISVNNRIIKTEATPIIKNDRVICPLRAIMENFGCSVSWNSETEEIHISDGVKSIILTIGSDHMVIKNEHSHAGEIIILDTPPIILNDRTMLPIRAVANQFDINVNWSEVLNRVELKRADTL